MHVTLHTWSEDADFDSAWSWDSGAADEVTDAAFIGGPLPVHHGQRPALHNFRCRWQCAGAMRRRMIRHDAKAVDARSTVVMLFNAIPRWDAIGVCMLEPARGHLASNDSGVGVDVAGEDIVWYGPNNFATIAATSDLGLGEGEWLFSRWTDGGVWQGGPTFGTQWDETPASILNA